MMNLLAHYAKAVAKGELIEDPLQQEILQKMQRLADELWAHKESWFPWWRKNIIKGIYLYGPIGAGKTFLIDFFYEHVVERKKARFHFHHFMQQIDVHLRKLQGHKDPIKLIAKHVAKKTRLLCFDEFMVHDVAYAMILAELLQALMHQGVIIVFSSNSKPDDLYLNGVHRKRFIPAIDLIKKQCDILYLNETRDYRLGREPVVEAYLSPLTSQNLEKMNVQFARMTKNIQGAGFIKVQSREIEYVQCGTSAIWFNFSVLCNFPRSQLDYLELADRFDTLFLSDIPVLTENHTAQTIMFIHLIDVLYDRGVKLVLSAEVPLDQLYVQGEMKSTFSRTLSRLQEMQSVDYLNRRPRRKVQSM